MRSCCPHSIGSEARCAGRRRAKMEKRRGAPAPISFFAESREEEDSHSGTTYLNRRGSNGENKEMRRIRRSEAHPLSNGGSDDKTSRKRPAASECRKSGGTPLFRAFTGFASRIRSRAAKPAKNENLRVFLRSDALVVRAGWNIRGCGPLSTPGGFRQSQPAGKSRLLVLRWFLMAALLTRDFPAVSAAGMDFIARRGYGILYIVPLTQYFR